MDEVGELLLGHVACGQAEAAAALAARVVARWTEEALPAEGLDARRLYRLVAGLCAADPPVCGRALASVADLPVSLDYPPPFAALSAAAAPR